MHKPHKDLSLPADPAERIWNYMDFTAYVRFLSSNTLYFCRLDRFYRPYELRLPEKDKAALKRSYPADPDFQEQVPEEVHYCAYKLLENSVLVSSWHRNPRGPAGMWKVFLPSNEGVAIESTAGRLQDAFRETPEEVSAGLMKYIDYESQRLERDTLPAYASHKPLEFSHENELRVFLFGQSDDDLQPFWETGTFIRVDIARLVTSIHVHPDAPAWLPKVIWSVTNIYGLGVPIIAPLGKGCWPETGPMPSMIPRRGEQRKARNRIR
jgi:hypothetical protein